MGAAIFSRWTCHTRARRLPTQDKVRDTLGEPEDVHRHVARGAIEQPFDHELVRVVALFENRLTDRIQCRVIDPLAEEEREEMEGEREREVIGDELLGGLLAANGSPRRSRPGAGSRRLANGDPRRGRRPAHRTGRVSRA